MYYYSTNQTTYCYLIRQTNFKAICFDGFLCGRAKRSLQSNTGITQRCIIFSKSHKVTNSEHRRTHDVARQRCGNSVVKHQTVHTVVKLFSCLIHTQIGKALIRRTRPGRVLRIINPAQYLPPSQTQITSKFIFRCSVLYDTVVWWNLYKMAHRWFKVKW